MNAPLEVYRATVRPEWIDYNGHMNVAYYLMAADHAMEAFCERIGVGESYMKETNKSTFALDTRIIYVRAFDSKRIHVCLQLLHGEERWISALSEWVLVHVDLGVRRSEPLPEGTLAILSDIMAAHEGLARHAALVRPFGLLHRGE